MLLAKYMRAIKSDIDACVDIINENVDESTIFEGVLRYAIILEDRRFFVHSGYDIKSIGRVVVRRIQGRRAGGASTICQQFVRTVTGRRERTLKCKIREIFIAYYVLQRCKREYVAATYLNIAYLVYNMTGIYAASRFIFGKSLSELGNEEEAFLAACIRYPIPQRLTVPWIHSVLRRARYALVKSADSHWVPRAQN